MIQDNRKTVKHSNFLISIKCYVWKGNGFTFRCRELKLWWAVIIQEIFSGYLKPAKFDKRLQQCDNPTHHSESWTVGTMKVFWEKASFSENKQILKVYSPVSTEKSILKKSSTQKMKFSIKNFLSKCDRIRRRNLRCESACKCFRQCYKIENFFICGENSFKKHKCLIRFPSNFNRNVQNTFALKLLNFGIFEGSLLGVKHLKVHSSSIIHNIYWNLPLVSSAMNVRSLVQSLVHKKWSFQLWIYLLE